MCGNQSLPNLDCRKICGDQVSLGPLSRYTKIVRDHPEIHCLLGSKPNRETSNTHTHTHTHTHVISPETWDPVVCSCLPILKRANFVFVWYDVRACHTWTQITREKCRCSRLRIGRYVYVYLLIYVSINVCNRNVHVFIHILSQGRSGCCSRLFGGRGWWCSKRCAGRCDREGFPTVFVCGVAPLSVVFRCSWCRF